MRPSELFGTPHSQYPCQRLVTAEDSQSDTRPRDIEGTIHHVPLMPWSCAVFTPITLRKYLSPATADAMFVSPGPASKAPVFIIVTRCIAISHVLARGKDDGVIVLEMLYTATT